MRALVLRFVYATDTADGVWHDLALRSRSFLLWS